MKFNHVMEEEQVKEPKTKESERLVFPEGEYAFTVKKAIDKPSKAGNDMLTVILICSDEQGRETVVFDWLLEAMKFKMKHFCETTGLMECFENDELTEEDVIGVAGHCRLIIEDTETYGRQNKVEDYVGKREEVKNPDAAIFDDSLEAIPF